MTKNKNKTEKYATKLYNVHVAVTGATVRYSFAFALLAGGSLSLALSSVGLEHAVKLVRTGMERWV